VLDAAGSERPAVLAYNAGGPLAALHAARLTERVRSLVLYGCLLRASATRTCRGSRARRSATGGSAASSSAGGGHERRGLAPTSAADPQLRAWLERLERLAASPGQGRRLVAAAGQVDVRPALSSIRVPALVLHRADDAWIDVRHAREYARWNARLVELPGVDSLPSAGDMDALLGEIEEFLTGARRGGELERLLMIVFSEIAGSTARAAQLCDKRWRPAGGPRPRGVAHRRALPGQGHPAHRRRPPDDLRRRAEPGAALLTALHEVVCGHGEQVRIGLHTAECELIGDDLVRAGDPHRRARRRDDGRRRDARLGHDLRRRRRLGAGLRGARRAR